MEVLAILRERYSYDDPLQEIEVPFVKEYLLPRLSPHISPFFLQHIHEVVLALFLYQGIFMVSLLLANLSRFGRSMSLRLRVDFCIHIVSMIQSILILILCVPAFKNPHLQKDHVYGVSPYGGMLTAMAAGYFLWDALICLVFIKFFGIGFLVHGTVSAGVFLIGTSPYIIYYAPIFLLFEASTPFLNIRWFAIKFPHLVSDNFKLVNNIVLILTFFFVRICWGWVQVYRLALDFYLARLDARFSIAKAAVVLISNFVLDVLNLYWFGKMLKVAVNTIQGGMQYTNKKIQ